ncbi:dolichyl-phosphate beta-glucosyltransferase [Patescibacteria group bacterium]
MYLSIIVPAYNEEKNLDTTIKSFFSYLEKQDYDYEIIIINDGSVDKTKLVAQNLIKNSGAVRLINNEANQGKGAAVRRGVQAAEGDYQLFIDADNATSLDHLDKVWPYFEKGYDIVIGSRSHRDVSGARQKIKQPLWKRTLGNVGNYCIQLLGIWGIWDTQCGFKIFSRAAAEIIIPKMTINRWAFDVEMLVIARIHNLKIAVIPIVWNNSSMSRVGMKGYIVALKELLAIKRNLLTGKYK